MKKTNFWLLASLLVAAFAVVACDKEDDGDDTPDKDKVTVSAETLRGTWDGSVEADFAQGYYQRWRIRFDGENYTSWHTHQTAGSLKDDVLGLKTVGNKEQGTWKYADGVLVLTPSRQWASYVLTSLSPAKYTYYDYNTETMESDPWYETPEYFIESGVAEDQKNNTDTYISKWQVAGLSKTVLSVKINMDLFKFSKQ